MTDTNQDCAKVEIDPQELLKLYNHAKGLVRMLGEALGRDVTIIEQFDVPYGTVTEYDVRG